jgi:hypothetical protein
MSKAYLTAAGSILTVEARHSAYVRAALREKPFAQPFDNPLTLNDVYTLAAQFIVSCPSTNVALPVKAFPVLSASSNGAKIYAGSKITLTTAAKIASKADVYAAFITVTGPIFAPVYKSHDGYTLTVPSGIGGQSYVILVTGNTSATDDNTIAGPAIVEVSD